MSAGRVGSRGLPASPDSPGQVLAKLLQVDGPGPDLDADTVDGADSGDLAPIGSEPGTTLATDEPDFENDATSDLNRLVGFYRDPSGVVRLRGQIDQAVGSNGETAFTLPEGYRPEQFHDSLVLSSPTAQAESS